MARTKKKLRARGGFTLAETLIVVLLIVLTSGILASTIQLAAQQFRARTQETDAQLLCSSLSLFVQNELTYAGNLAQSGDTLRFTDHLRGFGSGCAFVTTESGRLALEYGAASRFEVVNEGAYGGRKELREEHTIVYDGAKQVNVTLRVLNKNGVELAKNVFAVRPIAPSSAGA